MTDTDKAQLLALGVLPGAMTDAERDALKAAGPRLSGHVNAAPEMGRWGALCARLGVDPSASDEAVIAAARGRSAQPAPVRTERSRDVEPEVVESLEQAAGRGAAYGLEVVALVRERHALGRQRYGATLTTWNGRDAIEDALQEAPDGRNFTTQAAMEVADIIDDLEAAGKPVTLAWFAYNALTSAEESFDGAMRALLRARQFLATVARDGG